MTKEAKGFFKGVYMSFYGDKTPKISPSLRTTYSRMTLVSKDSSERLTIDFNIQCKNLRSSIELSDSEKKTDEKKGLQSSSTVELTNLVIIESKSMSKNCKSLTIMKENNFKKAKSCSKYGLGLVYCRIAQKYSVFEDTMRKISEIRKEMK